MKRYKTKNQYIHTALLLGLLLVTASFNIEHAPAQTPPAAPNDVNPNGITLSNGPNDSLTTYTSNTNISPPNDLFDPSVDGSSDITPITPDFSGQAATECALGVCGCTACEPAIIETHNQIKEHVTEELKSYRQWLLETYFAENIIPAMMLMAEQLTTVGIQQVQMIGSFFDAKHQLETQRLFQTLVAKAHKNYQPSEGVCAIGTNMRPLADLERSMDLSQIGLAKRMMDRQLLTADSLALEGELSDRKSRLKQFREVFCDPNDNGGHLKSICKNSNQPKQRNMDVNFTASLEKNLTLDLAFTGPLGRPASADEQNIFALSANIFTNNIHASISDRLLADGNNNPRDAAFFYLRQRSIAAKRSVAQNSFAALTAMRTSGSPEAAPFSKAVIKELGVEAETIDRYLGENPSYFAQMEVLTKKMYQNPTFYADLYDTPTNIDRKGAVLQAIALMQDRDIYKSLLRSEAVLSTLLETLTQDEHARISRDLRLVQDEDEKIENK